MLALSRRSVKSIGSILFETRCFSDSKMPSALLILAKGAEEMEAVISADVMRRGGIDVTIAGLTGEDAVQCSRNVVIKPDTSLASAMKKEYDVVVLPGGMEGAKSLAASSVVGDLLKKQEGRSAHVACICAAPLALQSHGIGKGKSVTSHPVVKDELKDFKYSESRVVKDNKLITSRGPGTAMEFGLAIVEELQGKAKRDEISPPMILNF